MQNEFGKSNVAIIVAAGIARSNSDARRKMEEGIKINGKVVTDPNEIVPRDKVDPGTGAFTVQHGQKKIILVKPKQIE
jgi:tyrosyl-tRNA synthetase